jgi:hypothetical protein
VSLWYSTGSDFAWGYGPTCGAPFVRKNAAFVFVSQPLGTNAYWNQKQADRLLQPVRRKKS